MYLLAFHISLSYIKARKRQSLVAILSIALGIAFFIGISSIMKGMQTYFIEKIIDITPHIIMKDEFRKPTIQPVFESFPYSVIEIKNIKPKENTRGIQPIEKIIKELKKLPELSISPVLEGQALIRYGGKDVSTNIIGINPVLESYVSNLANNIIIGKLEDLLVNSNGLIIGQVLANKLGLKVGDKVSLVSSVGKILNMQIIGIFDTGITAADSFNSYALLKKVQILQKKNNIINKIFFRLKNIQNSKEISFKLENTYGYRTESWDEINKNVFSIFFVQNFIMYIIIFITLFIVVLGIFNIISNIVLEKKLDIAILKSIGFSNFDVQKIYYIQGLIFGIIGVVIGFIISLFLIKLLEVIPLQLEGESWIRTKKIILWKSPFQYIFSGIISILCSIIASVLPAWKASKFDPIDIVRRIV